jgi:hypothetical protein
VWRLGEEMDLTVALDERLGGMVYAYSLAGGTATLWDHKGRD